MANNAPASKPSNATNSRINHKSIKFEMTSRSYHQPVVISPSGKVINKDKEMKLKPQTLKINTKQSTKRVEIVEPVRPVIANVSTNERHVVMTKPNMEQQYQLLRHSRKLKLEDSVPKPKDLRSAVVETISHNKQLKEAKALEKPETSNRQIRTKNQSHNTKVFFDKYLKFAYDLSTPTGVRQLEEHFFPNQSNCTPHSKSHSSDGKMTTARPNPEPIDQKMQHSKSFEDAQ